MSTDETTIGNREAVIIMNPTKYTLREDDMGDFEDDVVQSSLNDSDEDQHKEEEKKPLIKTSKKNKNNDKKNVKPLPQQEKM